MSSTCSWWKAGGNTFALSELIRKTLQVSASKLAQCREQNQADFPSLFERQVIGVSGKAIQQPLKRKKKIHPLLNMESIRVNLRDDLHKVEKWTHREDGIEQGQWVYSSWKANIAQYSRRVISFALARTPAQPVAHPLLKGWRSPVVWMTHHKTQGTSWFLWTLVVLVSDWLRSRHATHSGPWSPGQISSWWLLGQGS